jgi:hypothetical protein
VDSGQWGVDSGEWTVGQWFSFRLIVSGLVNVCAKSPNTAMDEALLLCSQILTSGKPPIPSTPPIDFSVVPNTAPDLAPRAALR